MAGIEPGGLKCISVKSFGRGFGIGMVSLGQPSMLLEIVLVDGAGLAGGHGVA